MEAMPASPQSRLSSDTQFWLWMALALPFSVTGWVLVIWWAFQEAPTYTTRFLGSVLTSADAAMGSMMTALHGRNNGAEEVAAPLAAYYASNTILGDPELRWGQQLSQSGGVQTFGNMIFPGMDPLSSENKLAQTRFEEPFSAEKLLNSLRESTMHSKVAFAYPRSAGLLRQSEFNGRTVAGLAASDSSRGFSSPGWALFKEIPFVPVITIVDAGRYDSVTVDTEKTGSE